MSHETVGNRGGDLVRDHQLELQNQHHKRWMIEKELDMVRDEEIIRESVCHWMQYVEGKRGDLIVTVGELGAIEGGVFLRVDGHNFFVYSEDLGTYTMHPGWIDEEGELSVGQLQRVQRTRDWMMVLNSTTLPLYKRERKSAPGQTPGLKRAIEQLTQTAHSSYTSGQRRYLYDLLNTSATPNSDDDTDWTPAASLSALPEDGMLIATMSEIEGRIWAIEHPGTAEAAS